MVKKQSAKKSPTKHASSSSSKGKKSKPNASALALKKPQFWSMNLLPERGYEMKRATPSFLATVANLHWDHLVLPRGRYIEELVREFYAGISEDEGLQKSFTSKVRGKIVNFHPKKINDHYMLKYNGIDFEKRVENSFKKEMENLRSRIATPDSVWERFTSNEIKLRSTYLIDALGNWHLFICTSILPTSHTYAMTKERLILLDTILSEGNVDIGRLIAREIYTCITKTKVLFYPCLITDLCMKEGVLISANEQRKFLSNNLNAEMKERWRKVRGPLPMPMPMPAMQEHFMQKQAAVWKFQNEQHDWLQLVFQYMSTELGNIEAPVFPSWVLRTEGKEEEEKEETDEKEEEKEEEEPKLKKRVTRKQVRGKKKVVVEPEHEETYDSEAEDEELEKEMDKESEEEEESDEEVDSEEEERARGVILEEIAKQKYAKTPPQTQQETTHTSPLKSPTKSPTKSPITSPTKEPSPPPKSPLTDQPVQSPPPHSPPPPSETQQTMTTAPNSPIPTSPTNEPQTEQSIPTSPTNAISNVVSALEKESVQEREEQGLDKEEETPTPEAEPEAVEETEPVKQAVEMQSEAPASDASASQPTAAMKPQLDEATMKLVLDQIAHRKREELGNTQTFFKQPVVKKPKRKISEAISTDATASAPEEPAASATPKPKSKKQKPFTPPTRQSSRTRSGAKK